MLLFVFISYAASSSRGGSQIYHRYSHFDDQNITLRSVDGRVFMLNFGDRPNGYEHRHRQHEVKQKKHVLSLDHEVDFELIGICSHHSDYRLAWGINQSLRLQLAKADELFAMTNKKGQVISEHSYHFWHDEENHAEFYLIKNKCDGRIMFPEKAQIDFFLFVRDNILLDLDDVVEELKKINSVMAAFLFDPETLPSAEQIVF